MLELRVLTPDDWPIWREVRLASLTEAPYAFGSTLAQWQGEGDREERWRARLEISGSHTVAAVIGDRPVGCTCGLPAEEPDAVELVSMWVSPEVRGQGVAGRLIGEVERWAARERRAGTLRLAVMPDNAPAIALYTRHGFKDTGEPGDLLPDGIHRELIMAKPLAPL